MTALITAGTLSLLAACAPPDFPEDPLFSDLGDLEQPELQPIDPAMADAPDDEETGEARDELLNRGEGLRDRADDLRRRDS